MNRLLAFFSLALIIPSLTLAETVKDREGAVLGDRAKMEDNERWIYNDIAAGFAEAKETGKPLMIVLRCVPCMSCMGIDAQVLTEGPELSPLLDQFVRVRLINANAIDMTQFQFDYDLSFTTLFFNGDGMLYGRYGSWEHQKDSQNRATETFEAALEGALKLHEGYPSNKPALMGKQGKPMQWKTPVDLPLMKERDMGLELTWNKDVVKSCVHCHQIGDGIRAYHREKDGLLPTKWIFPYPEPEALGIEMADQGLGVVAGIREDSPAGNSPLKAGDTILAVDGQPLISDADFSWALHNFPDAGSLPLEVQRGDRTAIIQVSLSKGWREATDISRRVGTWPMRAMAFGGMKLEPMDRSAKQARGLAADALALQVMHVGQYGRHALAKKQGFRKDDVIVEFDGSRTELNESEIIGKLLQDYKRGVKVPAVVLRGGKEVPLQIPTQ